jgi:cephalosporin-C deacetylase-like acetyl esterase
VALAPVLTWLLLCAAGAPQSHDQHAYPFQVKPYAELVKMFDYAADAPLDVRQDLLLERAGIKVFDVSFRSPMDEKRTSGYLVLPAGKGPFPAVVFLHSSGGRDAFLPAAILLARAGVVGLALQGVDGAPDAQGMRHDIVAVRRGFDLLAAHGDVDARRIGCVGHSYGSMMSAVVAGIDHRFKCFVFEGGELGMTYNLRFTRHPAVVAQMKAATPQEVREALEQIAPFDGVHYIAHAAGVPLLFQSARFDLGVSEQESLDFFNAATEPKELRWYESGHDMGNDPAVVKDRVEFLSRHLAFPSPLPILLKDMGLADRLPR